MSFITYSQNLEDAVLYKAFKDVDCGFYVDVGANHPSFDSVTRAFYDRGWHGINIEPIEKWVDLLKQERPRDINLRVFASDRSGTATFYEIAGGSGLSTGSRELAEDFCNSHQVSMTEQLLPARTLNEILEAHQGEIHFLKIDVEGSETAVLQGLDLDRIRPWIILVEATLPLSQVENYKSWEPLLLGKNYEHVYSDGLNRFYLAGEHIDIKSRFAFPPNIFDSIVPYQLVAAYTRLRQALLSASDAQDANKMVGPPADQLSNSMEYFHFLDSGLAQLVEFSALRIESLEKRVAEADNRIRIQDEVLANQVSELEQLRNSYSWRYTAPLRRCCKELSRPAGKILRSKKTRTFFNRCSSTARILSNVFSMNTTQQRPPSDSVTGTTTSHAPKSMHPESNSATNASDQKAA